MEYDAVIFDMDGVLVERTNGGVFERGVKDAFSTLGVSDPRAEDVDILRNFSALTAEKLERVGARYDIDATELWTARETLVSRRQLTEVAEERKTEYDDLEALEELSVSSGIVSNNQQATVDGIVDYYELESTLDAWYGIKPKIEDIERKKPNPAYIEEMIEHLDVTNPLYVGDKETDVIGAHNAGVDSALIMRSNTREIDFDTEPTYTLSTLHDLKDL